MGTTHDIRTWEGETLYDNDDQKIGEITDIYLDRKTGEPEWLAVKTGWFGTNISFVPLQMARRDDEGVHVPYDKALVKDAPNVRADGELSPEEERRLYDHYSMDFGDYDYDRERGMDLDRDRDLDYDRDRGTVGRDVSGPTTDDAMTRSEEEMHVGTRPVETGRARLRKYVETEHVDTTVPVKREQVRVEREPITDANVGDAMDGPDLSEEEHEVTLYSEEPVVEKRVVPRERVRLDKDEITEERGVSEKVRKERIDTDNER